MEAREEAVLEAAHVEVVGLVVVKAPAVPATKNLPGPFSEAAKTTRSQIQDLPTQNKNHQLTEALQVTLKMAAKESLHHHQVTTPSTAPIKNYL